MGRNVCIPNCGKWLYLLAPSRSTSFIKIIILILNFRSISFTTLLNWKNIWSLVINFKCLLHLYVFHSWKWYYKYFIFGGFYLLFDQIEKIYISRINFRIFNALFITLYLGTTFVPRRLHVFIGWYKFYHVTREGQSATR